ncbi:3D-(3,5/4)-trihydroxycyclohexane-1,2-dione acylhydrolase (decyclizing) [Leucobacter sp. cx-42]|uniref:3D-(3,5/4)-trihydroxycyclohexane-1,2-dione acylhydrolase (decyclizing) n=1 Tax=unclassified Leucobacter TaxID=2621730 RepID=UPI00165DA130|nr:MULTISPECIES: 3D-(3,5/4)-trihydroxycyclohexane-1,2-dione acylhydrolase (decyclizing) [unclassified Leucobacter]MBC9953523.1 3D-(3,5/4)-trihydroxycyclohexane-1,2-dione acylhydrolase (decyclizing) [Leucobacter sp. cx-42]
MNSTAAAVAGIGDPKAPVRRRTVAQAIIEYLQVQYSDFDGERRRLIPGMYGIFGHGNSVGLAQGIDEYGVDFPHYPGKNEQSMVHAAIGFAKASNRAATLACTASAGPGSTNMVTGAATATTNRLPVLLFPADIINNRFGDPVLQQIEHPIERDVSANDCFRPVSRYFDRITHPGQLLSTLPEAMRVLTDPVETGAVVVCLPQDVQGMEFDFPEAFFTPRVWHIRRRSAVEEELIGAAEIIAASKRPIIVAGGGVRYSKAQKALADFSDRFGIPVVETYAGKGAGPIGALGLGALGVTGTVGGNQIAGDADCVITVGTRLQDFITASHSIFSHPDVKIVNLNVGSFDAHKMGSYPVVGDAKRSLLAIHEKLVEINFAPVDSYPEEIAAAQEKTRKAREYDLQDFANEKMSQAQVINVLNERITAQDALVLGSGGVVEGIHKAWDPSNGAEIHFEYANSCMGHEIPAGLGYKLAQPDSDGEVYVLIGDGTYYMQPTELITAVQEKQKIIVIVIDNRGHQCIWPLQAAKGGGQEFGTQLRERNPVSGRLDGPIVDVDIAANAASMGAAAWSTNTVEEFTAALEEANSVSGPAVIVANVEQFRYLSGNGAFWDVGVPMTSQREVTREGVAKHLAGRERQRYYSATVAPSEN